MIVSKVADHEGAFMLHSANFNYAEVSDFADTINEEVLAHDCWLGIAAMGGEGDAALRFIGRALAHLAPDDAAFLVDADSGEMKRFTAQLRALMPNASPFASTPMP